MKTLYVLLIFVWLPTLMWAQPTITSAEDFVLGTVLKFKQCAPGVNPGDSGENITWDFSSITTLPDTTTEWMVSPTSVAGGSKFPTANLVEKYSNGSLVFVNKTEHENFLVGYDDLTDTYPPSVYDNSILFIKRPITYGTKVTDTFTLEGVAGMGIATIEADAYGKLILPNGTFDNVLRIKITENHPYFNVIVYTWFDNQHTSALFKIDNQSMVEYLLSEEVSGVGRMESSHEISLFPNPVHNHVVIQANQPLQNATLTVVNTLGEIIIKRSNVSGVRCELNCEAITSGIYFIQITEGDQLLTMQKMMVEE